MLDMHTRPSELMGIRDTYTAFCFDEACAYIIKQLQDGREPIIKTNNNVEEFVASKPSDLYAKYK